MDNEKFYQFVSKIYPNEDIRIIVYGEENFTKTLPSAIFSLEEIIRDIKSKAVEKISFCPHMEKYTKFVILDLDFHNISKEIKQKILDNILNTLQQSLNVRPNIIIDSGTGFHIYYLFDKLPLTKYYLIVNLFKTELQKKDLLNFIDQKSFSLNAYYRLPGVVNTKRIGSIKYIDENKLAVGDLIIDIEELIKNPSKYGVLISKIIYFNEDIVNNISEELLNEYKQQYINSTKAFVFDINSLDKENILSIENVKAFYSSAARMKNRVSDTFWEKIYNWFENGGLIKKGERHNCLIRLGLSMTYWFGKELTEKFLKEEKIFENQEDFYIEERLDKLLDDWEKLCPKEPQILSRLKEGKENLIFDYKEFFDNYIFIYSQPINQVIVADSVDNVGFFIIYDNNEIKYLHRSMKIESIIENLIPVDFSEFGISILEEAITYVKKRKTKSNNKIDSMLLIRYLLKYLSEQNIIIKEKKTSDELETIIYKTIQSLGNDGIIIVKKNEYEIIEDTIVINKQVLKPLVILLEDRNEICLNRAIMSSCYNDLKDTLKKQMSSQSGSNLLDSALRKLYQEKMIKTNVGTYPVDVLDAKSMPQLINYIKLITNKETEKTNDQ